MEPEVSVIVNCYNSYPVMKQCLDALFTKSSPAVEVILVDQHSPDEKTRDVLRSPPQHYNEMFAAVHSREIAEVVTVLDPGRNLGTHCGWNYGYQHSACRVCVKLDDDTVVQQQDWDRLLAAALDAAPEIAILAADCNARQGCRSEKRVINGIEFEVVTAGIVGFSCVAFRRKDLERWDVDGAGPMSPRKMRFHSDAPPKDCKERLYGGEEEGLAHYARGEGRLIAYLPSVKVWHLGIEERDRDYTLWKRTFGYRGRTDKDLVTWRRDGDHVKEYEYELQQMLGAGHNHVLMVDWCERLAEIGTRAHLDILKRTAAACVMDGNHAAYDKCLDAAAALEKRTA